MPTRHPTREEVSFYRDNGYLIVPRLFPEAECDRILKIFEDHADGDHGAMMNPDRELPEIAAVLRDGRCVGTVEGLQGGEVSALMSQVLFKEVGTPYASQAWNPHQDNTYPRSEHGAYITINIFLCDADRENGTLYVFPGSHKEDLLPCVPTVSYHEIPGTNPGNTVQVPEKYKKTDLTFKKGDLVVLHGNVIHGSYPNVSKTRSRPMYSISYIKKGKDFIPGEHAHRMVIPVR